jgi:signal transduction histidine kinase/ligand-binding sensor domain-containing protein
MKCLVLWIVGLQLCGQAWSGEADLSLQQLNHKGWTVADGAPGVISSITQTTDGTLWLAGPDGLSRFDGIRFVRYDGSDGRPFESTDIRTIADSADGGLWIGFNLGGISFLKNGNAVRYGERDGLPSASVNAIVTDHSGVTYAATTDGLYRLQRNRWERVVIDPSDPKSRLSAATVDRAGTLWLVTDAAVLARPVGAMNFREISKRNNLELISAKSLANGPDGKMWVRNLNRLGGVTRLDAPADSSPGGIREFFFDDTTTSPGIFFDREGNLWLGGTAVRRLAAATLTGELSGAGQRMESFTPANGLTGLVVNCFFEDREGNIWAGTGSGLDRFSRSNVVRMLVDVSYTAGASVAGEAGTVWTSSTNPANDGTYPILEIRNNTVVRNYPAPRFTNAYRSPDGSLWFGGPTGIARFNEGHLAITALPYKEDVQAMVQDRSGAMWVSVVRKGVFRLADGQWSSYENLPALPHAPPIVATADSRGRLWFGYTENRIARVDGPNVALFDTVDGLSVGNVTAIAGRLQRIWIGGERGLARFDGARFSSVLSASNNPFTGISGIVELETGDLWLNGNVGIVHLSRGELEKAEHDSTYRVHCEIFDYLDGMTGYARQVRPVPTAFEGTDGRLWFALHRGLVSISPSQIKRNPLPPPVTIWSISGAVQYPALSPPRLPIHTTNVRIEYTAASLTIPERVRFSYKLEGLDREWQDAGNRREAVYTNLGPGRYTFHVIASNNDGVWNTTGASLPFSITPAFYQTKWFYGFCALLFLALLRVLYMIRIQQVSAQLRGRLEERLTERERIARELHDTLLQSVQGLVLRFRAAVTRIPKQESARSLLEQALDRADEVLTEGRDRVKYLRSSPGNDSDLAQALAALGKELAVEHTAHFRSTVEGIPRDLHPIIREEALFIAREALINAFRHSNGRQIEVELSYGKTELRLGVRDDGQGIDVEVLHRGERTGHWGLLGMRERAKAINATVTIWSKPGAGTEVDLRVPAHTAYQSRQKSRLKLWRRKSSIDAQG